MNNPPSDSELDALFAQARALRPDTSRAEYGFETRLLAQLRARREAEDPWGWVAWRIAPFFAACAVGLAVFWHSEVSSEPGVAEQFASFDNADTAALWDNLN